MQLQQVAAVRVNDYDETEAALQRNEMHFFTSNPLHRRRSSAPNLEPQRRKSARYLDSAVERCLDEEVFLAQLSLRARLLNFEFQRAIIRVVQSHEFRDGNHSPPKHSAVSERGVAQKVSLCGFPNSVFVSCEGTSSVQVQIWT